MPQPHEGSPLRMLHHELVSVRIDSVPQQHEECLFNLETERRVSQSTDHDLQFEVELTVSFGPTREDRPTGYTGTVTFSGIFEVAGSCPAEKRDLLVNITGPSILFGACREMVANLTARGKHGMLTLPSVSFTPGKPRAKTAPKKGTTKGKVRRKQISD